MSDGWAGGFRPRTRLLVMQIRAGDEEREKRMVKDIAARLSDSDLNDRYLLFIITSKREFIMGNELVEKLEAHARALVKKSKSKGAYVA